MSILALDLAPTNTGVCVRSNEATEVFVTSKLWPNVTSFELTNLLIHLARSASHVLIEDVPPTMRNDTNLKNVYRLQGRILQALDQDSGLICEVGWVRPHTWETNMGVWRLKKNDPEKLIETAYELGMHRSEKRMAKDVLLNMADAYLIAEWGKRQLADRLTLLCPGLTEFRSYV